VERQRRLAEGGKGKQGEETDLFRSSDTAVNRPKDTAIRCRSAWKTVGVLRVETIAVPVLCVTSQTLIS
jgi:hypothetical protein